MMPNSSFPHVCHELCRSRISQAWKDHRLLATALVAPDQRATRTTSAAQGALPVENMGRAMTKRVSEVDGLLEEHPARAPGERSVASGDTPAECPSAVLVQYGKGKRAKHAAPADAGVVALRAAEQGTGFSAEDGVVAMETEVGTEEASTISAPTHHTNHTLSTTHHTNHRSSR